VPFEVLPKYTVPSIVDDRFSGEAPISEIVISSRSEVLVEKMAGAVDREEDAMREAANGAKVSISILGKDFSACYFFTVTQRRYLV
jgi:hypothetical protein